MPRSTSKRVTPACVALFAPLLTFCAIGCGSNASADPSTPPSTEVQSSLGTEWSGNHDDNQCDHDKSKCKNECEHHKNKCEHDRKCDDENECKHDKNKCDRDRNKCEHQENDCKKECEHEKNDCEHHKKKCEHLSCEKARPSIDQLWPPNHKFQTVTIEGITGTDVETVITSIRQDEVTHVNPGDPCPDATGVSTDTAQLRSERFGNADGRVYHIAFTAYDREGNDCSGEVTVCVPHDQGKGPNCVDEGALYDSTSCNYSGSRLN